MTDTKIHVLAKLYGNNETNKKHALQKLEQLGQNGNDDALLHLALFHCIKNPKIAIEFLQKATENGNKHAPFYLWKLTNDINHLFLAKKRNSL